VNGNRYDGEWKENQRNGLGIHTFLSGHRYDGEWKEDKRNG
jgi:hypothetical protein